MSKSGFLRNEVFMLSASCICCLFHLLVVLLAQESHCVQKVSLPSAPPGQMPSAATVEGHLNAGLAFHSSLQAEDGHFPGDYGGPMFLMPGLVIACYVTGVLDVVLSPDHKQEMVRYLRNHQNEDGGYGLHIEGHSTMFGTGLRCALFFWVCCGMAICAFLLMMLPYCHACESWDR
jgi:hypothetical protein